MNLIIKTNPEDWDKSTIVADGLTKDGLALSSAVTQKQATLLPKPYLKVWHAIVDQLKGNGDGEVVCVMATACIVEKTVGDGDDAYLVKEVELVTHWQYPDGRRLPTQKATLDTAAVIDLVEFLLTPQAYDL